MKGKASMMPTRADGDSSVLDEPDPEVDAEPAVTGGPGSRPRPRLRRERRQERAFAREIARAVRRGRPSAEQSRADAETLGEYLARVEAPRLPRRSRRRPPSRLGRGVRLTVAGALLGACVAVPWAVPEVPAYLADLVPGHDRVAKVEDPVVSPPSDAFVGPVGIAEQAGPYDGVRLQSAGPPREVVVPRLHVDSTVLPISGQSGSLLPPSDPKVLGWWQEGQPAGAQYGSAVVTGHTVHTGGGALDHLDQLVVGDSIKVRTDQGWIRYAVQRTRIYSTHELARDAAQVFRLDGTGRLVLITCDNWNGSFYESNAVVFASPVDDQPN